MIEMIVEELTEKDEKSWDDFVNKTEGATFYHLTGWERLIYDVYGNRFEPIYLIAKNERGVAGILPLFFTRKKILGNKLISVPFGISGGICTHSDIAESILLNKAVELCLDFNADYLELRNIQKIKGNLITNQAYFTLILKLAPNPEMLWRNFRKGIKLGIKTAEKSQVKVDLIANDLKQFYVLYAEGQRNLGTPVQSYTWIKQLFNLFSDHHTIAMAYYKNKVIGVQFVRKFKDTISSVYAYTLPKYKHLCPNQILIWELIKDACENGYQYFDFGRSLPKSGTYFFKIGWRAQPVQLNYQYYLNKSKNIPDTSQSSFKRKKLATVWKKMPVSVANRIGPVIRGFYP